MGFGRGAPQMGIVRFVVSVPRGASAARNHYVSPSTRSISIVVTDALTKTVIARRIVNVASRAEGCDQSALVLTCATSFRLEPRTHFLAHVKAFDQLEGKGNLLGASQRLAFNLKAATIATINLGFNGIPHSLSIASGGPGMHGSQYEGFTLYGTAGQPVVVSAQDADGNTIVGAGAPKFTLSVVNGSGWSVDGQPGSANMFLVMPGSNGSGAILRATATVPYGGCSKRGAVCKVTFTITDRLQTVFAAGPCASVCTDELVAYTAPYNATPTVIDSTLTGTITSMAFDGSGNLFIDECHQSCGGPNNPDSVVEYAPPYTGGAMRTIAVGTPAPGTLPAGSILTVSSGGTLFVTGPGDPVGPTSNENNYIYIYAPPYGGGPFQVIDTGRVSGLAVDANGLLAYSYCGGLRPCENQGLTLSQPPYTGCFSGCGGFGSGTTTTLAFDTAGDLFQAASDGGFAIWRGWLPPSYTSGPGGEVPSASDQFALDESGNLFFANPGGPNTFVRVSPFANSIRSATRKQVPHAAVGTTALVVDGADNVVTFNSDGSAATSSPPYSSSIPLTVQLPSYTAVTISP